MPLRDLNESGKQATNHKITALQHRNLSHTHERTKKVEMRVYTHRKEGRKEGTEKRWMALGTR